MTTPRSPAQQLAEIRRLVAGVPDGQGTIEVVLDIYWIFLRHAPSWPQFHRMKDLGKWIARVPPEAEALLQRVEALLPYLATGQVKLVKITNTSTPGACRDGAAKVVVYCAPAEREGAGVLLRATLGWTVYWKTNAQTHAELAAERARITQEP